MVRVLHFLSKTDAEIIKHCPISTKNIQASLGFFVLLTGVMAFIAGGYALSNMFIHENPLTGQPEMMKAGWLYAMVLGLVYAVFIMAIDREIVSSSNKRIAVLRIPLAIIISMIVAVPIEMQLFEGRINRHLKKGYNSENDAFFETTRNNYNIFAQQKSIDSLEKAKDAAIKEQTRWGKVMIEELSGKTEFGFTGKAGEGRVYREAELNQRNQQLLSQQCDEELKRKNKEFNIATQRADSVYKNEKKQGAYDLLSKYIALNEVEKEDATGAARRMGWGVTILLCLFELIPALMKVLLPKTEYDILLDKRRLLNIKVAISIYEQAYYDYQGKPIDEIAHLNKAVVEKMFNSQAI